MAKKTIDNDALLANIIAGIEEVKGNDIEILDLREIDSAVCDYYVICNGNSNTQVNAIVNSIQKTVSKELKDKPWHVEGSSNAEWVLMDYVHIVVHVFQKQIREYYNIESLWGDAKITTIANKY
ncbi:ribosome silencing factor [Flavobacterium sp. W1B]|uniref:ribosome silencing factor n=1 Tax=Flavobacterium sp. W1B TaxID=3394146 RepID=UPI0039BCE4B7